MPKLSKLYGLIWRLTSHEASTPFPGGKGDTLFEKDFFGNFCCSFLPVYVGIIGFVLHRQRNNVPNGLVGLFGICFVIHCVPVFFINSAYYRRSWFMFLLLIISALPSVHLWRDQLDEPTPDP